MGHWLFRLEQVSLWSWRRWWTDGCAVPDGAQCNFGGSGTTFIELCVPVSLVGRACLPIQLVFIDGRSSGESSRTFITSASDIKGSTPDLMPRNTKHHQCIGTIGRFQSCFSIVSHEFSVCLPIRGCNLFVSLLKGGYSDKAWLSGTMAHLVGLVARKKLISRGRPRGPLKTFRWYEFFRRCGKLGS
jgi:hypothetical protein